MDPFAQLMNKVTHYQNGHYDNSMVATLGFQSKTNTGYDST